MAWGVNNAGWWGEGEIKFFLDDDGEFPTICGTGILVKMFHDDHNPPVRMMKLGTQLNPDALRRWIEEGQGHRAD